MFDLCRCIKFKERGLLSKFQGKYVSSRWQRQRSNSLECPSNIQHIAMLPKKGGEGLSRGLFIKFGVFKDYRTYLALTKVTQLDDLSLHT